MKSVGPKGLAGSNPVCGVCGIPRERNEKMKLMNVTDIDKFFEVVNTCEGKVELVTGEGDRLNLKSTLTQYVAFAQLFSDGCIPEMELICQYTADNLKFLNYAINGDFSNERQSLLS